MGEITNRFWELIEAKMGSVPNYLKNILTLMGYENAMSIKTISEKDIESFQKYLISDEIKKRIPPYAKMEDYVGVFWETPEKAYILPGHVKFLQEIVEFVNLTLVTKGCEYFTVKTKVNQRGSFKIYGMFCFSH